MRLQIEKLKKVRLTMSLSKHNELPCLVYIGFVVAVNGTPFFVLKLNQNYHKSDIFAICSASIQQMSP